MRAIIVAICILALTACWDKVELENRAFVSAVGVDSYKHKPENAIRFDSTDSPSRFVATASIPSLVGKGEGSTTLTSVADAFLPALWMIRLGTSQEPYYGQTKAMVLGEGLLKDAALFAQAIDAMERNREISRKVVMLACKGDAQQVLKADTNEDQLGMHIANFYTDKRVSVGIAFKKDLDSVLRDLRRMNGTVIPRVAVNGGVVELSGAALVSEYQLVGWLGDTEVRGLLLAKGMGKNAHMTVDFGKTRVPLRLASQRARLKFKEGEQGLVCELRISAKGSIEEYVANSDTDISSPESLATLNILFAEAIEAEVMAAHTRLQESGVDALSLTDHLRKFNYSLYEEYVIRRGLTFADITLLPVIDVHVTDVGSTR